MVGGVFCGAGPVRVVGSFDVPLDVLAFDDSGVGAGTSGGVESAEQPAQEGQPAAVAGVRVVRGESRPGGRWFAG